jgi:hypothetical protein
MYKTQLERKKANLNNLQERTQKIVLRREIKKAVKEQILFERKKQLNEGIWDSVMDLGQMALDAVGAFPPLEALGVSEIADAANAAIHFTRGLAGDRIHFLYGLLSLISVIPMAGDVVAKPIEYIVRLGRLFGEESAIARNAGRIATFVGQNSDTINSAVRRGQQYIVSNRGNIEKGLKRAQTEARARNRQRNASMAEANESESGAESTTQNSESETGNSIIDSIVSFILGNDTLRGIFENSAVIEGIMEAYDQLKSIFDRAVEALTNVSGHDEEQLSAAAQQVQTEALKRLNESKAGRVSLKVLF